MIECKNLVGNIDINSKGAFIRTVTYGTKKQKEGIYSPITQGERHLSVLKEAKLDNAGLVTSLAIKRNFDSSYKSLVVLANPKTIVNDRYAPKEIKSQVIRSDQLVSNMKNIIAASNDFASTKKEMMSIAQGILDMNIESRKDYAAKYEELVKENELSDSADTKNEISDSKQSVSDDKLICPKCGSKLVLRTANKGENAGKQFYGCSNFPKCRFILNIKQ